jgi:hypothetical protein
MLLIMHHIALFTSCIALFNCGHLLHIQVDHTELGSGFQAEQVQWTFGEPQASSCEDANIIVIKASLGASNPILAFCLPLYLVMILECALGYMSWIDTLVALRQLCDLSL